MDSEQTLDLHSWKTHLTINWYIPRSALSNELILSDFLSSSFILGPRGSRRVSFNHSKDKDASDLKGLPLLNSLTDASRRTDSPSRAVTLILWSSSPCPEMPPSILMSMTILSEMFERKYEKKSDVSVGQFRSLILTRFYERVIDSESGKGKMIHGSVHEGKGLPAIVSSERWYLISQSFFQSKKRKEKRYWMYSHPWVSLSCCCLTNYSSLDEWDFLW